MNSKTVVKNSKYFLKQLKRLNKKFPSIKQDLFDLRLNLDALMWAQQSGIVFLLFLGLSPLAITMGLIWKTKEVILDSVFGAK